MNRPKITVFGSGIVKENSPEWKLAYRAGFLLGKSGFVVANGGYGGTMAASAKGAKAAGAKTIGVTTDEFQGSLKNPFIDKEIRVKRWRDRLFKLIELGEGFLVLDGGTGTMVELITVVEMINKGMLFKPVVVVGKRMHAFVRLIEKFPDVRLSNQFGIRSYPKRAVSFLRKQLSRADESFRF